MRDNQNGFDPRHPHERDGRDLPPIYDEEGRCLRCSWEYHTGEIERLVEAVRTRDTRITELTEALRDYVTRIENSEAFGSMALAAAALNSLDEMRVLLAGQTTTPPEEGT